MGRKLALRSWQEWVESGREFRPIIRCEWDSSKPQLSDTSGDCSPLAQVPIRAKGWVGRPESSEMTSKGASSGSFKDGPQQAARSLQELQFSGNV